MGSTICAAGVEILASSTSVMLRISDELKPAEEAAKATMAPTIGERPTARKAMAPRGMRITYTASEAMDPVTPAMATTKVSIRGPTLATMERITALMSPACSATATPSMTTTTTPSGGNST